MSNRCCCRIDVILVSIVSLRNTESTDWMIGRERNTNWPRGKQVCATRAITKKNLLQCFFFQQFAFERLWAHRRWTRIKIMKDFLYFHVGFRFRDHSPICNSLSCTCLWVWFLEKQEKRTLTKQEKWNENGKNVFEGKCMEAPLPMTTSFLDRMNRQTNYAIIFIFFFFFADVFNGLLFLRDVCISFYSSYRQTICCALTHFRHLLFFVFILRLLFHPFRHAFPRLNFHRSFSFCFSFYLQHT